MAVLRNLEKKANVVIKATALFSSVVSTQLIAAKSNHSMHFDSRMKIQLVADSPSPPQSFEREQTRKLDFEPSQMVDPGNVVGNRVLDEDRARALKAQIAQKQDEIDRLEDLIQSGKKMMNENSSKRSAQIKIGGSLILLENNVRRLKSEIEILLNAETQETDTEKTTELKTESTDLTPLMSEIETSNETLSSSDSDSEKKLEFIDSDREKGAFDPINTDDSK